MTNAKYDRVAILLHWIVAILMVFMLFFGENLMEADEGGGTGLPSLHVSIGVAILLLSLFRLAWRLINPPPDYPASMRPIERTASTAVHVLFYVLLIGLPLTGLMAFGEFAGEHPAMAGTRIFGLVPVPGLGDAGLPMGGIHEVGSKLGIALLLLHVAAALKHQFIDRDNILARMRLR